MRLSNMFSSDDGCAPNILKEAAAQAWSPENPNGTLSRLSFLDPNYNMRASDMWVKNGDFLRISNIQIGYTLPKNLVKKASIQNARVYLSIQNLATLSGYNKYGEPRVRSRQCALYRFGYRPLPDAAYLYTWRECAILINIKHYIDYEKQIIIQFDCRSCGDDRSQFLRQRGVPQT